MSLELIIITLGEKETHLSIVYTLKYSALRIITAKTTVFLCFYTVI